MTQWFQRRQAPVVTLTLLLAGCAGASPQQDAASHDAGSPTAAVGEDAMPALQGDPPAPRRPLPHRPGGVRATGNEPSWLLTIDEAGLALRRLGWDDVLEGPAPQPTPVSGGVNYRLRAGGHRLSATVLERACTDTMSGMPHPDTVILYIDDEMLRGCGGDPRSLLLGEAWEVVRIDGSQVLPEAPPTLRFDAEDRVVGMASCNRFNAPYTLTGESLGFDRVTATLRACEPAVMEQETAFFRLLEDVRWFGVSPDGELTLYAGDGRRLVARPGGGTLEEH